MSDKSNSDRVIAAILAFFLGGIGGHHFFLGNTGRAIVYLVFCWTFIPGIVAFVEGIRYLMMSDSEFDSKFHR